MQQLERERQVKLLTSTDTESKLQEEVEFLHEQVESLQLELRHTKQQLQETDQELRYVNHELHTALKSGQSTHEQAKQLAKVVLVSQKPTRESLAELLSNLYDSTIEPWELGWSQSPTSRRAEPERVFAKRAELKAQRVQILGQFNKLQSQVTRLKPQYYDELRVCVTETRHYLDQRPNPSPFHSAVPILPYLLKSADHTSVFTAAETSKSNASQPQTSPRMRSSPVN